MAQKGNDWNSFMQEKPARILLNGLCTVLCGYYAIGAVIDLVRPGESQQLLITQMGQTGYIAMTVVRLLVMLWATVAFGRTTLRTIKEKNE